MESRVAASSLRGAAAPPAEALAAAWMEAHGQAVLRLAYAFLRDRQAAEDVFQEVFLKAHAHADSLGDEARVRPWLLQVTANRCRDLLRSAWWRRVKERLWGVPAAGSEPVAHDPEVDPVRMLERAGAREAVAQAVWALPDGFRETVVLHYFEGLDTAAVARLTGVREGTVHSRLHRARHLLKAQLQEWGDRS